MTSTTVNELRTNLIGAWTLQSYESTALDGSDVTYPLGVDARGIIMYTQDGYMSAQLMRADRTPFDRDDPHHAHDNELAAAAGGYLSYSGPFSVVDDGLIAHHVEVSLLPNWIGGIQYRTAHLQDSCLVLGPPEPMMINGVPRYAKLVWRRT
ncbi:lipocalin-like domain-containing protein [Mycobacterium sp. Aquia_216]|uniref:lipocalin-like domain-containing protein n=1 Tax=Mycobacterium sp. Aquia_216 TaxID=2991729 RepID=UPI00227BB420|nr:lipocalin-like domain-containing protein [Mycobacterium sp. Aquia_216]WAJ46518.1 lipocalin-like domain-containing protein [Mycobacterium sp. Aquia_216]